MTFLAIFLALTPKFRIHFRQLLHSTQDFEILDHGSKCLPLDEKWWDLRIFRLASITEALLGIATRWLLKQGSGYVCFCSRWV